MAEGEEYLGELVRVVLEGVELEQEGGEVLAGLLTARLRVGLEHYFLGRRHLGACDQLSDDLVETLDPLAFDLVYLSVEEQLVVVLQHWLLAHSHPSHGEYTADGVGCQVALLLGLLATHQLSHPPLLCFYV